MTYKHKSNGTTCSVIDRTDNYVIYQYVQNGIRYTSKVRSMDFMQKWELSSNGSY